MTGTAAQDADLIVIGSGMGGLTVASLATQLLGWRVLVLERHGVAGGFTHAFSRGRWRWDVGLHYVSGVAPGSPSRALFDLVTGGLEWDPLPERFDVLHLPGERIELPWRETAQAAALAARFPAEASAIERYFRDLARLRRELGPALFAASAPPLLAAPMRLATWRARRLAARCTGDELDARFRDPTLKLAIAGRWPDYGLAPGDSAFGLHAMVLGSYAEGAARPRGGAPAIAAAVTRIVEQGGGALRTRCAVERVLVERGRAVGVSVRDAHGDIRVLRAPRVVSAAGAASTYRGLLPPDSLPSRLRGRIEALAPRGSAAVLYLGLRESPKAHGLDGANHWLLGHDALAASTCAIDEVADARSRAVFVSTADGDAGRGATVQAMVPMRHADFAAWAGQPWRRRGADYEAIKQRLADGLLRQVDAALPGLAAQVEHRELSTPLSVETMTGHPNGAIYGLAGTPTRFGDPLGAVTPVKGLWLAGADVCTPGVQGALMGGVFATAAMIGLRGMPLIQRAARSRGP
jgi:phytoene dehydrogenase-like protein